MMSIWAFADRKLVPGIRRWWTIWDKVEMMPGVGAGMRYVTNETRGTLMGPFFPGILGQCSFINIKFPKYTRFKTLICCLKQMEHSNLYIQMLIMPTLGHINIIPLANRKGSYISVLSEKIIFPTHAFHKKSVHHQPPSVTNWYLNASIYHRSKNYWFVHSYKLHCHLDIILHITNWLFYRQKDSFLGKKFKHF